MNSGDKIWDSVKSEYLRQIETALSKLGHTQRSEILEDVNFHLEQRYSELTDEQKNWENYQAIITDMGPPSDYADLLQTNQPPKHTRPAMKTVIIAVVTLIAIAVILIAVPQILRPAQTSFPLAISDELPHPFENDPRIVGRWESVDFVKRIEDFQPGIKLWQGELFLKQVVFTPSGGTSIGNTWTNGWIYDNKDKVKAEYKITEFDGRSYLFFPWLSGDVTIRGMKPRYYVLEKKGESRRGTQINREEQK